MRRAQTAGIDDLDAAELEGLALLVPDDPRSLDGDRMSYLRELRDRRDAGSWPARIRGRLGRGRLGLTGPAVILVLACVAVIGSSLTLFSPQATTSSALVVPARHRPAGRRRQASVASCLTPRSRSTVHPSRSEPRGRP